MKVTKKVHALESTKGNYAYLVFDEEITVIDTGMPRQGKTLLKELESLKMELSNIKHIMLTHHDIDHIGNVALLEKATGAKVWASKEDIPYIYGEKSRPGIKKILSIFMKAKLPEKINPYPENGILNKMKIIPSPGHTPGHVCILFEDVLFAGDLLRTSPDKIKPMMSLMNWNDSLIRESITKIDQLSFKWICPAHGVPIKRGDLWEEFLEKVMA
ncbi:MAG: MBL fold metallo-hydrolase [Methanobacteriaceae archaeon]|nr:MBL fold metallo-hydrolase [Methanobacteriaceae archaeon]MDP3035483.1 MBL fold metallo-hydrolase [Methanobacteriaceae archaeon]MDP3485416.1 MBL fold metallo-hydrolase [Methanobacteriaceae archaeon]MDP3623139.1 MBL fold metallo-hydrolase [Methanobacteriaceae archaeon]